MNAYISSEFSAYIIISSIFRSLLVLLQCVHSPGNKSVFVTRSTDTFGKLQWLREYAPIAYRHGLKKRKRLFDPDDETPSRTFSFRKNIVLLFKFSFLDDEGNRIGASRQSLLYTGAARLCLSWRGRKTYRNRRWTRAKSARTPCTFHRRCRSRSLENIRDAWRYRPSRRRSMRSRSRCAL